MTWGATSRHCPHQGPPARTHHLGKHVLVQGGSAKGRALLECLSQRCGHLWNRTDKSKSAYVLCSRSPLRLVPLLRHLFLLCLEVVQLPMTACHEQGGDGTKKKERSGNIHARRLKTLKRQTSERERERLPQGLRGRRWPGPRFRRSQCTCCRRHRKHTHPVHMRHRSASAW